jgi:hypothetical protein
LVVVLVALAVALVVVLLLVDLVVEVDLDLLLVRRGLNHLNHNQQELQTMEILEEEQQLRVDHIVQVEVEEQVVQDLLLIMLQQEVLEV